ncbi:MAG TPA: L,D-transpeptidase [Acidimicrobiia bacterium]|nr:L,D-transpeptidase [Acidimicrobiia bacterium]
MRRALTSILAVLLVACQAGSPAAEARPRTTIPAFHPDTDARDPSPPVPGTATSVASPAATTSGARAAGETLVAHAEGPIEIFEFPHYSAGRMVLEEETILGTPRVLRVLEGPWDGWIKVALPLRPNGSSGWALADRFKLEIVDQAISVDLVARSLSLTVAGAVVLTTEVAIGSLSNPTPTGSYFVTDIIELADPSGPWGPYALGLSAFSDTITEFNGGDGIIGIHGTNRPDKIGQAVSLGCVRVPNGTITRLASLVDLGVPAEITG